MSYWLMKTEPDVFSFEDLVRMPSHTDGWEGIRNYQARNFMRDDFKCGDQVFIYHSRTKPPAIVGVAEVVREAYPDDTALDPQSPYFDEKSAREGVSRWVRVDVKATKRFAQPLSLEKLRSLDQLRGLALLKRGQRLSIQPVSSPHWQAICNLERLEPI